MSSAKARSCASRSRGPRCATPSTTPLIEELTRAFRQAAEDADVPRRRSSRETVRRSAPERTSPGCARPAVTRGRRTRRTPSGWRACFGRSTRARSPWSRSPTAPRSAAASGSSRRRTSRSRREGTVFSLAEVKLGILPAVISPYVLRAIGPRAARDLFLTGDRFDAREAQRIGLVHQVVPAEELEEAGRAQGRLAPDVGAGGRARREAAHRAGRREESRGSDGADRPDDRRAARLGGGEGRADGVSREAQAVVVARERRNEGNTAAAWSARSAERCSSPGGRTSCRERRSSATSAGTRSRTRPRAVLPSAPLPRPLPRPRPLRPQRRRLRPRAEGAVVRRTLSAATLASPVRRASLLAQDPSRPLMRAADGPVLAPGGGPARPDRRDRRPRHGQRRLREGPAVGNRCLPGAPASTPSSSRRIRRR